LPPGLPVGSHPGQTKSTHSVTMKCFFLLAVLAYGAHALKSVGVSFGPKNCVMLSRSSAGSCVITTDCEGVDTTKLEFAFDCVGQSGNEDIVRHSFGVGGFEGSEEFDTEVKCSRCASASSMNAAKPTVKKVKAVPKPVPAAPKPVAAAPVVPVVPKKVHTEEIPGAMVFQAKTKTEAKTKMWPFTSSKAKKEEPEVVKYGPNNCVSVHKSSEGHCIMNTDCAKDDISNYEFGLVCVDKVGSPVKHLFGKDSFDAKESFDTLIKCDQCLGLEDVPDSVALAGEVATMGKEIAGLKAVLKNISINVQMLNTEVFPPKAKAAAPGPSPAAAAPAPAAADAVQLVSHQSISHHKRRGNLRRSHRHHHHRHRRRDDDDDDDDDEDREDEEDEKPETPVQYLNPSKPVQYYQAPPPVAPSVPASDVQQAANSMISATNAASDDDDDEGSDED